MHNNKIEELKKYIEEYGNASAFIERFGYNEKVNEIMNNIHQMDEQIKNGKRELNESLPEMYDNFEKINCLCEEYNLDFGTGRMLLELYDYFSDANNRVDESIKNTKTSMKQTNELLEISKQSDERIEKLEAENENLFKRLSVYQNFIAGRDIAQDLIDDIESDMQMCIEEGFVSKDYDWKVEKELIKEYQSEMDLMFDD